MEISDQSVQTRLLAVITFLLVGVALRQTYAVTMPLAAAAIVVAAVWPIKPWLQRYMPAALSNIGTVLVLVAILVVFAGAVSFSVTQVAQAFTRNADKLQQLYQDLSNWVESWGGSLGGGGNYQRLMGMAEQALRGAYNVLVYLGVIAVLVIFGLPEVRSLQGKIDRHLGARESGTLVGAMTEIASKIRQYLLVTTLGSVISGVTTLILALLVGLDLALVWALLNFLLNYIPIVGPIIGIAPPALYAFIQFDGWTMPGIVLVSFTILQIVVSNFIQPLLQGKSLSLTPMAVIVAISIWGWIWGVAGAFIAVPLTSAAVVLCSQFSSTRWIAILLSDDEAAGRLPSEEKGGALRPSAST